MILDALLLLAPSKEVDSHNFLDSLESFETVRSIGLRTLTRLVGRTSRQPLNDY